MGDMVTQQPSPAYEWTFRRVMWATLLLVFVVLGFWLVYRFYQVAFILFIAIIIATVIRPVVNWLKKRGIPPTFGIILIYIILVTLFISFLLLLFPLIFEQTSTISAALPGYYSSIREWLLSSTNILIQRLSVFLPATLPGISPSQQTGPQVLVIAGQALGYITLAVKAMFIVIAVLLLAFHWTLSGQRTIQSLLLLVPKDRRESINQLVADMSTKVGYYVAGQGFLCLVIGAMALIAYLIIGLPNALVLAFIAGALEAVPMIGPILGAIPAAVIALSMAPSKLIWVIIASLVIQQLENSFLVPRVMRKAVGVNPFVSLLAIFAFSSFFGIAGALMAIPIAAIIQLILDRYIFHPVETDSNVSPGRDLTGRLRYELRDLASDLRKQTRFKKVGSELDVKQIDRVMDEVEAITTDLDGLLSQIHPKGTP